jgi:hypothetical protein
MTLLGVSSSQTMRYFVNLSGLVLELPCRWTGRRTDADEQAYFIGSLMSAAIEPVVLEREWVMVRDILGFFFGL